MNKIKDHSSSLKACKNPGESLSSSEVGVSRDNVSSLY